MNLSPHSERQQSAGDDCVLWSRAGTAQLPCGMRQQSSDDEEYVSGDTASRNSFEMNEQELADVAATTEEVAGATDDLRADLDKKLETTAQQ